MFRGRKAARKHTAKLKRMVEANQGIDLTSLTQDNQSLKEKVSTVTQANIDLRAELAGLSDKHEHLIRDYKALQDQIEIINQQQNLTGRVDFQAVSTHSTSLSSADSLGNIARQIDFQAVPQNAAPLPAINSRGAFNWASQPDLMPTQWNQNNQQSILSSCFA